MLVILSGTPPSLMRDVIAAATSPTHALTYTRTPGLELQRACPIRNPDQLEARESQSNSY